MKGGAKGAILEGARVILGFNQQQQHPPHQHRPHRPQHGIAQQHPHTSTVRTVRSTVSRSNILTHPHTNTVRSTVSLRNILTPAPSAPSAARYHAATSSHQHRPHRPQHGIAQHHPHTSTVRTVRSTVSRSNILTPAPSAPSAARYRAATSSHQHRPHRPQHGTAQQHPHTSTVRTVRSTVSRSTILTPAPSAPSAARYRAAPSSHQHRPRRPQHGIAQQHPHTSTVRTVRSTVSRTSSVYGNIFTTAAYTITSSR